LKLLGSIQAANRNNRAIQVADKKTWEEPIEMSSAAIIGQGAVPVVRLSCFHGDEVRDFVRDKWEAATDEPIEAAYAEAVRRLPVDDMPDLVECLSLGGHCLGLLDPVSNVILNSLNLLCRRRSGTYSPPAHVMMPRNAHRRHAWSVAAFESYMGIIACIRAYFLYVTEEQAKRYIHISGGRRGPCCGHPDCRA
jgi:hypothetical protein